MKLLILVLFIHSCASWTMKSDLQITNDTRRSILLSQFGFYSGGYLEIILSNFTAQPKTSSMLFGFSLERNFCERSAEPYLDGNGNICIFKDLNVWTKEIAIFMLDLDNHQLYMKCEGIYNYFNIYTQQDFYNGNINKCSNLKIPVSSYNYNGNTYYSTSFFMEVRSKQEEGLYALAFHRCPVDETIVFKEPHVDFNIEIFENNSSGMKVPVINKTMISTTTTLQPQTIDVNNNPLPNIPFNMKILPKMKISIEQHETDEIETTTYVQTTLTTNIPDEVPVVLPNIPVKTYPIQFNPLQKSTHTSETDETTIIPSTSVAPPTIVTEGSTLPSSTTVESTLHSSTSIQEHSSLGSTTIGDSTSAFTTNIQGSMFPTHTTIGETLSPTSTTIEEPTFSIKTVTEESSAPTSVVTEPGIDIPTPSNNSTETPNLDESSGIVYIIMSILFFVVAIAMLIILIKAGLAYKVHFMMVAVMFLKGSVLVLRIGGWYYSKKYKARSPIWDRVYYGADIARGGLQSITQLLYGTGWDVTKHTLTTKETILLIIAAPVQILALAGKLLLPKSEETSNSLFNSTSAENLTYPSNLIFPAGQMGYNFTGFNFQQAAEDGNVDQNTTVYSVLRIITIVLDWSGTIFMLIPVVLTMLQIRARRRSIGRCSMLRRFRVYFVLLLVYLYGTRVLLYEFEVRLPNRLSFVDDIVNEVSTFIFVVLTGIIFGRPLPKDSQFSLNVADEYQNLEGSQVYRQLQRSLVRLRLVYVLAIPNSSISESSSSTKILKDDFRYIDMSSEVSEKS